LLPSARQGSRVLVEMAFVAEPLNMDLCFFGKQFASEFVGVC
jgi:hypothetical protein